MRVRYQHWVEGLTGDYKYGPANERQPPSRTSVFKVNPQAPTGQRLPLLAGLRPEQPSLDPANR